MNLYLDDKIESGSDAGRGNLLGIQPYMLAADYASEETFFGKIEGYLEAASQKGWLNPRGRGSGLGICQSCAERNGHTAAGQFEKFGFDFGNFGLLVGNDLRV